MTGASHPTIFESFNARELDFRQVAKTFVSPSEFPEAIRRCHTIILGPRGSGKTTILKMMHPEALDHWRSEEADEIKSQIDFSGVFIPADRSWTEQLLSAGGDKIEPEFKEHFARATFTTHVLRALVSTMHYRCSTEPDFPDGRSRQVVIDRKSESEVVRAIADQWYLSLGVPSLLALKQALTARLSAIWEFIEAEKLRGSRDRASRIADVRFLSLNYLSSAEGAVELFDDAIGQSNAKWALLFDELEIVPEEIRNNLREKLRSASSKFLFKLSMSPYDKWAGYADDGKHATVGNDYNQVPLWYAHKERGRVFCQKLFRSIADDFGLLGVAPTDILARSQLDKSLETLLPASPLYARDSPLGMLFADLADRDSSFREYLRNREAPLHSLDALSEDERAATVRKVRTLVEFRATYLKERLMSVDSPDAPALSGRSRKNPGLYSGVDSLFAIAEGNPRWFNGIVGTLIKEYSRGRNRVTPERQSIEVDKALGRFRAYLKTVPAPFYARSKQSRGLLNRLDDIGEFFAKQVYGQDFQPDPILTFTVDSRIENEFEISLGRALNAGAIVFVNDPGGELILNSLRGRRFRLSFLLATHYGLPLIMGKSRSVSFILTKGAVDKPPPLFRRSK
jgi:hypothetical protein